MTISNSFYDLNVTKQDLGEVVEVCHSLKDISYGLLCHAGELSLLPILKVPEVVFISSDSSALRAFQITARIDPRFDPPHFYNMGDEFPE